MSAMVASAPLSSWKSTTAGQVDVGQDVAGDHDEALVELVPGVEHRSGRAERRLLGGVDHADAELGAVAEVAADGVGHEGHGDHDVGDAVAGAAGRRRAPSSGRLAIGSIGLGWLEVSGRSRVPSPPAMITAFTMASSLVVPTLRRAAAAVGQGPAGRDQVRRTGGDPRQGQARDARRPRRPRGSAPASRRCRGRAGRPGRRTSSPKVPALPTHSTSIRAGPEGGQQQHGAGTRTSRAMVATPNHSGHRPVDHDGDHRRAHQEPVGRRVQHLAEGGHLVVAAGHEPVDPVGGPEHGQEHGRRVWRWAPKSSQTNSGMQASRTMVMALGSGEDPVESGLARVGRVGSVPPLPGSRAPVRPRWRPGRAAAPSRRWPRRSRSPADVRTAPGCARLGPVPRFEPFRGLRYDPERVRSTRSSPRPTTSSARPSGSTWPAAALPTPSASSCPSPTCGPAATATGLAAELLASWLERGVLRRRRDPVASTPTG